MTMATIIIATDFTDVATNAVEYGCNMAQDLKMSVLLLHSYIIPVSFQETPMPVISLEESKRTAEEQMKNLKDEVSKKYPDISIVGHTTYGDITDSLKETIAEYNAWMVVVGNSSAGDNSFWLGSNLLSTLRNLKCPVVAVPETYNYKSIIKIAFACDFKHVSENLPADDLVNIVLKTKAELHVLNVDHENISFHADTPYEYEKLNNSILEAKPVYHNVDNEEVEDGIQSFIKANDIDWLVVLPHKHSFFESLFHKSQTKAIVRHAEIPIVALHEKD